MNVIIAGAGTVGINLAEYFSRRDYHVTIIEQNESLCEEIKGKHDIYVVTGEGSCPATLESAGIRSADMLIAVTPHDETNLLACNFAMQNGVKKRIARIRSEKYTTAPSIDLKQLGVTHVIEPEWEVVKKILQYVELPDVIETTNFQSDSLYLRGIRVTEDMPIAHKTLMEVRQMSKTSQILIVVIIRKQRSLPPTGNQRLLPGDKIVAIMSQESFKTFRSLINRKAAKLKKIIVSGESLTAIHLAKALRPLGEQIVLLDPDPLHGQMAASMLDGIEVFQGDSTNSDILQEFHVENADVFIAAGKDPEDNIMSCLLAKNMGARMVIALRNNDRYMKLFNSIGIDHVINPQDITANMIIETIQMVPIGTYLELKTVDIEILRLKANKNSLITGKYIRELDEYLRNFIIVGAIIREDKAIIPWGGVAIEDSDEVIMLCRKEQTDRARRMFTPPSGLHFKPRIHTKPKNTA